MIETRRLAAVALVALLAAAALAACGSGPDTVSGGATSTTHAGGAAATLATAPAATCQQLNGIFADGPDPDADPVGYALSQILPLQQLRSSDSSVMTTVTSLVGADQSLVTSNGGDKASAAAIEKDDARLDRACPGVAP